MDGYVIEALSELKHIASKQHFYSPSKMERPDYGAKVQYVKEDTSLPLSPALINYIQKVVGKFLYLGRAIDNTTLHSLNEIAIATTKGTEATLAAVEHFLNYMASNPSPKLQFRASDMILHVESDAAYLVCPKARSRAGGFHYLSNKDGTLMNSPIWVLPKVIKNVMASAAESEVASLFMKAQEAVSTRTCLIEMGHPQPATKMKTDNMTAQGILTGTIKQKRSKAIDMRFYWLKDRVEQGQFKIYWAPGDENWADYFTKHHSPTHHKKIRPIYLKQLNSPSDLQGCLDLIKGHQPAGVRAS